MKQSLAGQTGLRVDASWASQAALIHGFAQFQSPDLILHEDRLVAGLDFLLAEVGAGPVPYHPVAEPANHPLMAIHDADIEAAAQEAYARDYLAFGFGPFQAA